MTTTLNVQFSDATEETIISYFASPQNADNYSNLGTVTTADSRWATYYATLPVTMAEFFPAPTAE
jgi:hypothetical protein